MGLNRANHRGTVKKQISHTIKTEMDCGVIEIDKPKRLFNIYNENYGTGFAGNVWDENHIAPGLMTMQGGNREPLVQDKPKVRIRKLTPKECIRLMGFDDSDYEAMAQVNSDTQIYKQAGNSIVVNVLSAIFKEML